MAVAAIAEDIEHNVFIKAKAISDSQQGSTYGGIRIVSIDVENGRLDGSGQDRSDRAMSGASSGDVVIRSGY